MSPYVNSYHIYFLGARSWVRMKATSIFQKRSGKRLWEGQEVNIIATINRLLSLLLVIVFSACTGSFAEECYFGPPEDHQPA